MRDVLYKIVGEFLIQLGQWFKAQIATPVISPPLDYFQSAMDYLTPNEGGYSNRVEDHGGPTNFGITQERLSEWRGHAVSADDVKNMKADEAKQIYQKWYWADIGLDKVKVKPIAIAIFDQGVLNGQITSVMMAQRALNNCGENLTVDGGIGPLTLAAMESVKVQAFLSAFKLQVMARFDSIVANDDTQQANYGGWTNRANRLLTLA